MEGRTKNSFRNVLTGFGNKIISFVLAFATKTVFIRLLGAEYTGINGLYSNILQVLSMADLGMITVLSFKLYTSILNDNKKEIASTISYYRKFYTIVGCTILGIGIVIIPFLHYIINSSLSQDRLILYYILFLANTSLSYFFVYKTTLLEADQKQYIISNTTTIATLVMYVLQIVYLLINRDYFGYLIIQLLCTFCKNFILSKIAEKKYPYIKNKALIDRSSIDKKGLFADVKATFIYKICTVLLNNTDNILISVIVSTVAVGYYSNYYSLIQYIGAYMYALSTGLTASIGSLNAEQDAEKSYSLFNSILLLFSGITCVCVTVFACCVQSFVPLWIGDEYLLDYNCVVAVLLLFYFSTVSTPSLIFRETMGLFKQVKYVMIPTVLLNIGLSIILGKIMGIAGIIYATSISKIFTNYWYEPYLIYKTKFHSPYSLYLMKQIRFLISTILSVVISLYITSFLGKGFALLVCKAIIAFIISALVWFGINRRCVGMSYVVNKIKGLLRKE